LLLEAASVGTGGGSDAMKESDLRYGGEDVPDWMLELERCEHQAAFDWLPKPVEMHIVVGDIDLKQPR
jgi:hypothetical protein